MARIALFADGTGNARTARFRTNVWKLYDALDDGPGSGQIGFYHDGVGTSAFAPLRLLGGVFGIGLARNVRQLYAFLCRNHASADDEIFLFGFSRGAFTARILAGLIACQGVRHITDEAELARWVGHAYRANRLRSALAQVGIVRRVPFRLAACLLDRLGGGDRPFAAAQTFPDIRLVGVWDTVAAYGGPVVEMVRGFDRWVWPLSMPDYRLSPKVLAARHALSLDEEREAFLPLPWDEIGSAHPERIRQVWFAGVHSDVGGGYADDGLSGVALAWMLAEAKAAGLAFAASAEAAIAASANAWGPIHDSRSGVGVAYRYQPRSIDALMGLTPASPLRDPESGDRRLIREAVVHPAVLARIGDPDGYAPIVLPSTFADAGGARHALPSEARRRIGALVRRRRRCQWLLLATAAATLLSPLAPRPDAVAFADQALSVPLGAALAAVPLLPGWLKAGYAADGTWLLAGLALVLLWLRLGERARMATARASAAMWAQRTILPAGLPAGAVATPAPPRGSRLLDLQRRWQRFVKWRLAPAAFGLGVYALAAFALVVAVAQAGLLAREADRRLCVAGGPAGPRFRTGEPCHATGRTLRRGAAYRVRIVVGARWRDDGIDASPAGFGPAAAFAARWRAGRPADAFAAAAVLTFATAVRRVPLAPWFAPVIAVRPAGSRWLYTVPLAASEGEDGAFHARFVAPADGAAFVFVNDAIPPGAAAGAWYAGNRGTARVEIVADE